MSIATEFQSHQIVRLECANCRVYAEVIQVVTERHLCWARPLAMLISNCHPQNSFAQPFNLEDSEFTLLDLRQGADLLLPLSWFQAAIDVEVVPILVQLNVPKVQTENLSVTPVERKGLAHRQLQQFIQQLCQARLEAP